MDPGSSRPALTRVALGRDDERKGIAQQNAIGLPD